MADEIKIEKSIKYVVIPGEIVSQYDEDMHYINAVMLMELYGVDPSECVVKYGDERDRGKDFTDLIELRPLYHGHYEIPK